MADNQIVPVKRPGLIARAAQAVAYTIAGVGPETWMSPLQPLRPMAEQSKGRAWDYPVAFNLNYIPRASEPLSFLKLKQLAEYGITRAVIQTRIDQMMPLEYIVRPKDEKARGIKKRAPAKDVPTSKADEIMDFLQSPDKRNDWQQWLAQLLDQHFVYDGMCVYKRRTRGATPYAWEIVDAATISIKIDADGRPHPPPPSPAYQQVLKGLPTSNYSASIDDGPQFTTGDMLYYVSTPRVDRAYGFPRTAQIVNYVEMTFARAREQLAEWTQGNAPRGVMEGPPAMTTEQINAAQLYWDALFAGNIDQRRRIWWVPNGTTPHPIERSILVDAFDEWLARVICYAFSVSVSPFIKQMNRANAQSAQEIATEEGHQVTMALITRFMNRLITDEFQTDEYEFAFVSDDEFDPSKKAVIDNMHVRAGIRSIDEVRDTLGEPLLGGAFAKPMYATGSGYVPVDPEEAKALNPPPAPFGGLPGSPTAQQGKLPNGKAKPAAIPKTPLGNGAGKPSGAIRAKSPGQQATQDNAAKAEAQTLLIKRPLLNAHELVDWAKNQGFVSTLPPEDMHVTQCYSRDPVLWADIEQAPSVCLVEGAGRSVGPLGDDGAVVLHIASDELQARWAALMGQGVSHDHDGYHPHVTISYNPDITGTIDDVVKDADGKDTIETRPRTLDDVVPFPGALLFGEETWKPINEDWRSLVEKMSAEEVDAAAAETDPNPSQAQIEAGNYRHGHVEIQGLDISVENEAGSQRSGVAPDGTRWTATLPTHYGYARRTIGADGEHVDIYIGPNPNSDRVWIIDQAHHDSGGFDEHKAFVGYDRWADAQSDYLAAFSDGRGHLRIGAVTPMSMDEFKTWLAEGDTTQPLSMKSVDVGTGLHGYDQGVGPAGKKPGSGTIGNYDPRQDVRLDPQYTLVQRVDTASGTKPKKPWLHGHSQGALRHEAHEHFPETVKGNGCTVTIQFDGNTPTPEWIASAVAESVRKFNPNHAPGGSPEGGQFTSDGGGGGGASHEPGSSNGAAAALFDKHADKAFTANDLFNKLGPETRAAAQAAEDKLKEPSSVPTNETVEKGGFKDPTGQPPQGANETRAAYLARLPYTAERQLEHDRVMAKIFTDEKMGGAFPKPGEKPTYTMLGGRGGSGKSYFTREGGPVDAAHALKLDSDEIKGMLPEYRGWNAALVHEEASDIFEMADQQARAIGMNVIHDSTMKTAKNALTFMDKYDKAGYDVKGYYMFAPPQMSAERAIDRFMKPPPPNAPPDSTGRYVPPHVILSSTTNERTFDSLTPRMKDWAIYTGMTNPPTLVARKSS